MNINCDVCSDRLSLLARGIEEGEVEDGESEEEIGF